MNKTYQIFLVIPLLGAVAFLLKEKYYASPTTIMPSPHRDTSNFGDIRTSSSGHLDNEPTRDSSKSTDAALKNQPNVESLEQLIDEANKKYEKNPDIFYTGKLVGHDTYLNGNASDDAIKMQAVLQSTLLQPLKDKFLVSYLGAAGSHDFERVKDNILKLSQDDSIGKELIGESLRLLSFTNVKPAFDTLVALPWTESYGGALVGISANWVMDDPETASAQIKKLKGSPSFDWAVAGLVQATRATDPSAATTWRNEIKKAEALALADSITYTFRRKY